MKKLLLPIFFTLLACGKVDLQSVNSNGGLGDTFALETAEKVSGEEIVRLQTICQAMARKATVLSNQLPTTSYTFDVTKTNCDGVQTLKDEMETLIIFNGVSFTFQGLGYPFPNVETHQLGVLAPVCQNLNNLQNPIDKGNGEIMIVSTLNTGDCPTNTNELCVQIRSASKTVGNNFQVHTSEWLRFFTNPANVNSPIYGFYTERLLRTTGNCGTGKFTTVRSVLRR